MAHFIAHFDMRACFKFFVCPLLIQRYWSKNFKGSGGGGEDPILAFIFDKRSFKDAIEFVKNIYTNYARSLFLWILDIILHFIRLLIILIMILVGIAFLTSTERKILG